MRLRAVAATVLIFVVGGASLLHFFIQSRVSSPEFKAQAEKIAGEFLKANVQVKDIRVGFLNQIALTGVVIEAEELNRQPYHVRVNEISFHYDLWNLLAQNFHFPSGITLKSPQISVQNQAFPYAFFSHMNFNQKNSQMISSLELKGGTVRYDLPSLNSFVEVKEIDGAFNPIGFGKIHVDFDAMLTGILEGQVKVEGEVDIVKQTHTLSVATHDVRFGQGAAIPFKNLNGKVLWEENGLFFKNLQANIYGWKVYLRGELRDYASMPNLQLECGIGKERSASRLALHADLISRKVSGELIASGQSRLKFDGGIRKQGYRYFFDHLLVNEAYDGLGWMDLQSGDYQFDFRKDRQKVSIQSNLKDLDFQFQFQFNHVEFYGLDVVTSAQVRIAPVISPVFNQRWRFRGSFKTDYFIANYIPFEDFQGSFELNPRGIKNIDASWGKVFELTGQASFHNWEPDVKLFMQSNGFNLEQIQQFADKPLPRKLEGSLEGKVKIEGRPQHPEIEGDFVIKNGQLGRLDFDRGILHFRGYPPMLKIYDSRILRGRLTIPVEGAIDLSLTNIFNGVKIETGDNLLLLKGWEVNMSDSDADIELTKTKSKWPLLGIQVGSDDEESLGIRHSDQNDDETHVLVGPKLKF